MDKKVLSVAMLMVATVFAGFASGNEVMAAGAQDAALKSSRDSAAQMVINITGKAGAEQYIDYLNAKISQADCYLNGPSASCDYAEKDVIELTKVLDEGVKATALLTTERPKKAPVATSTPETNNSSANVAATTKKPQVSNASNKNTATKVATSQSGRPTQLPEASYETNSVARDASEEKAANDAKSEAKAEETKDVEVAVEVPEAGKETGNLDKTEVKDNAPLRIVLAVVAGAAILVAGVVVIRKWSQNDV